MDKVGVVWFIIYGQSRGCVVHDIWTKSGLCGSLYMDKVGVVWFMIYGQSRGCVVHDIWTKSGLCGS